MRKVLRIWVKQSINTQEGGKLQASIAKGEKKNPKWKPKLGNQLPGPNLSEPIIGANGPLLSLWLGPCSKLSAGTWYARYTHQKWEGNNEVLAYFTPPARGESGTSYNSAFLFPCLFVLSLSIISTPSSSTPQLAQLARQLSPCACIYVGGNRIGKVIEKLSCRSGWFVEPVHALIHPAAPPHK